MKNLSYSPGRKVIKWTFIGAIIGEVASVVAGFYVYSKMKNSRDFRKKIYDYDHRILDGYYRIRNKLGHPDIKQDDAIAWGIQKSK